MKRSTINSAMLLPRLDDFTARRGAPAVVNKIAVPGVTAPVNISGKCLAGIKVFTERMRREGYWMDGYGYPTGADGYGYGAPKYIGGYASARPGYQVRTLQGAGDQFTKAGQFAANSKSVDGFWTPRVKPATLIN